MFRIWIAASGVLGALGVVAGALGAHAVTNVAALAVPVRVFDTAQLYHAFHTAALLGTAILIGRDAPRATWAGWALNFAAAAFVVGILCFCGGIYFELGTGNLSWAWIVPVGGSAFIAGWVALTASAFDSTFQTER